MLLAGVLGAWLASRATDGIGSGTDAPAGAPAKASRRAQAGARPATSQDGGGPAGAPRSAPAPAARAQGEGWSAPQPLLPQTLATGPKDWSSAIATGLAPPLSEEEASVRMEEDFRKLGRDLEFSAGLREPIQQRVAPVPEPWRPDPEVADRPSPVIEGVSPAAAPAQGGAEVVIRGRNLRAAQVMFGMAAAHITRTGPDEIAVVVPPGSPGQVRIALTNDDGHFALAAAPFTLQR